MDRFNLLFKKVNALAFMLSFLTTPVIANETSHNLYQQHNLVSDGFVTAEHTDSNLINPWGISFGARNPAWVANKGSGTATVYDGLGKTQSPQAVTIPPATNVGGFGKPTGIVFNDTTNWMISSNGVSAPAVFIFATSDGTISAWAPSVSQNKAIIALDNSKTGASYRGLTKAANGVDEFLYVANFSNGTVDVFDDAFKPVLSPGRFIDPNLPNGYAPFNIQNLNGDIYVTYAKQDENKKNPVKGSGFGIVNVFDADGKLIRRIATFGVLDAPWGIAISPNNWGPFSNKLLIANFGDGRINAFDQDTNELRGHLRGNDNRPLTIEGLWSIEFGNGFNHQPKNVLYFSAGPANETHGIYGTITPIPK